MIIIGIIAILAFLVWVSKPGKGSGVILYFANIGTGKTTYLSKLAQEEIKKMKVGNVYGKIKM